MSMAGGPRLGAGREFDLIRTLAERWGARAAGIGDDAAVLDLPRGERLVASVDASVENRHFRREWLTAREIGYRAVAAALSDLAAMAALPRGVLVALALPNEWQAALDSPAADDARESSPVLELADGIGAAAADAAVCILGGNVTASSELSVTTTVLGSAFAVLARDGVRAGDQLYVTGVLGGPGAALRAWRAGAAPMPEHRARFAHPVPRIHEARWLAERGAGAAIDISDGLAADAGHLAAASGLTIELEIDRLPLVSGVGVREAAASGEEYELLVASPRELDTGAFAAQFGIPLTRIGRALTGEARAVLVEAGARVADVAGHDHLSA